MVPYKKVKKDQFKRAVNCVYRIVDKKAIIFLVNKNTIVHLNNTATRIWTFLSQRRSRNDILSQLRTRYNLSLTRSEEDGNKFINEGLKSEILEKT